MAKLVCGGPFVISEKRCLLWRSVLAEAGGEGSGITGPCSRSANTGAQPFLSCYCTDPHFHAMTYLGSAIYILMVLFVF